MTINKQTIKAAAGSGMKGPDGPTLDLPPGKYKFSIKLTGKPMFAELYADEARLGEFLRAMTGLQAGNFSLLAERFDFEQYRTVTDVGGALALLSRLVAARHPHLRFQTFDLPPVRVHAQNAIDRAGLADRIQVVSGDFFVDPFPLADVRRWATSSTTGI
jgi:hypothetical protein